MAKLTDEEIRILQRARMIQDRLEAERLEAGEELPPKKVQPNIQKQKLERSSQQKTSSLQNKPSRLASQPQKTTKIVQNHRQASTVTEPQQKNESSSSMPEVKRKRPVRQPVGTVEEKRNYNFNSNPVRQPVGTIHQSSDTMGNNRKNGQNTVNTEPRRRIATNTEQARRTAANTAPQRQTAANTTPQRRTATNTEQTRRTVANTAPTKQKVQGSASRLQNSVSNPQRRNMTPKKKKTEKWKVVVIALIITALIAAIAAVGAFIFVYSNISKTNYESVDRQKRSEDVWAEEKGVKNILLLGTDERINGDASRSDAIIVLSINENTKKIIMTSILRDSYVTIPGYGENRINHAYQMGGAALMMQTIEDNFKIPIDSYAKVDFFSFMGIIDKLGGVPITVTPQELGYLNGYIAEINTLQGLPVNEGQLAQAGAHQLTGKQALGYSRIRYIGTDFARTERQRTVLDGLFQQLKTASVKELYDVMSMILPDITTDIKDIDLTKMIAKLVSYMKYDIVQNRIPMDGTWQNLVVGGQEVLGIDFTANQQGLKSVVYGE
ncbi:MAG: LCP family protein [Candidatus Fimimorpha sp.]